MKIPIRNIYFLLIYAWNRLPESKVVDVSAEQYPNLPDLLARVLINGCNYILKSGLDKDYLERTERYKGVKGKIQFSETLKSNALRYGRTVCSFDEYSEDILQNQILKSAGRALIKINTLDKGLRNELQSIQWKLQNVSDVELSVKTIDKVVIHRNNYFYHFLLSVCRLIAQNAVLDEETGEHVFKDFIQDEVKMRYLFEDFTKNFYKIHAKEYHVHREHIKWQPDLGSLGDEKYLPRMETDISLDKADHKLIVETKFTPRILTEEREKYRSEHMYQLFAYLSHTARGEEYLEGKGLSGLLLYPTVSTAIDETYTFNGIDFRVATINLAGDWKEISDELLGYIQ